MDYDDDDLEELREDNRAVFLTQRTIKTDRGGVSWVEESTTRPIDDHITEAERDALYTRYTRLHNVNLDAPRPDSDCD